MDDLPKMLDAAHEAKKLYDDLLSRANVLDSGEARISTSLCLTISEQYVAVICPYDTWSDEP